MIKITKWPNDLIIILKRFFNNSQKNNNNIDIPIKWRHNYELISGIIHIGNCFSGHYIAFKK